MTISISGAYVAEGVMMKKANVWWRVNQWRRDEIVVNSINVTRNMAEDIGKRNDAKPASAVAKA